MWKKIKIIISICIILFAGMYLYVFLVNGIGPLKNVSSLLNPKTLENSSWFGKPYASTAHGWELILVNRDNYIPKDYDVELTELSNGEKVDSRIYPELQEMFDDARAEGYALFVREGYRTQEEQQQLLDEKIEAYQNEGKSKSESKKLAEKCVALPGTSEHQLGIAVDINADTAKCTSDEVYNWLDENAYKYGFIKRYPSDKTDITRVINEPWHYRYVGKDHANAIYSRGQCLEEYVENLGD